MNFERKKTLPPIPPERSNINANATPEANPKANKERTIQVTTTNNAIVKMV